MRCKNCGYRLWNAVPGGCSECGTPWRFEDFRFVPGKVQFCCNACGRAYMGMDEVGLPMPRSFDCSGCGAALNLSNMRAMPAAGVAETAAMVVEHEWTHRKQVGRWRAFWTTVGQSLGNPRQIALSLPRKPSVRSALWFAILVVCLPVSIAVGPALLLPMGLVGLGSVSQPQQGMYFGGVILLLICTLGLVQLVAAIISALCTHFLLRLTGAVKHSLRYTLCTSLYCLGPYVCSALPCCGIYLLSVSMVWSFISFIIATKQLQETGVLRAIFVVLAPPIGSNLALAGLVYWISVGP